MLCCPTRLPFNDSNRLPGGTRSESRNRAALICASFRIAAFWTRGWIEGTFSRCHRRAVALSARDLISSRACRTYRNASIKLYVKTDVEPTSHQQYVIAYV